MAEKNDAGNKRYYEKFNHEVNNLVVYASAASINAKVECLYPESFLVAFLSTGEHEITLALAGQNIDLEKLLKEFKAALESYQGNKPQDKISYEDLRVSKKVDEAIGVANTLSSKTENKTITCSHIFVSLIELEEVSKILLKNAVDVDLLKTDILKEKYKKTAKAPKQGKTGTSELLDSLCIDVTEQARQKKLDPILARDEEIEEAITVLCRRHKRNPILVGEPGVGKSAIVDGIAQRIVSGTVPPKLKNSRILSLNISDLVAGTKFRGEFETRVQSVLKEIENDQSIILFIDEVHMIVGAGGGNGAVDAANMFKPALARGMRCIGATTNKEYKKHIEGDGALERRFERIMVDEPSHEQVRQILTGIKHRLEEYHSCIITSEAIEETITLCHKFLPGNFFPDKAIDCLDTACAKYAWTAKDGGKSQISTKDIQNVISRKSKVPLDVIGMDNLTRLKSAEDLMQSKIVGQDQALKSIFRILKNSYSGVRNPDRPSGIFVFGGESGTGKTFTASELGKALFKRTTSFIRIDMSEYSEKHTVSRIIGSPPGYVGYEDASTELDKIKRNPYSLVLLDEVEKADPQVMKLFLQYMKDGFITDSSGDKINCRNTILVMTGNFGLNENKTSTLGFSDKKAETLYDIEHKKLVSACKNIFGVEFVNRVDEFIPFMPLKKDDLLHIINMHLIELKERIKKNNGEDIILDPAIAEYLILMKEREHGINAMMIDRLISKVIEPLAADALTLAYNTPKPHKITIFLDSEKETDKLSYKVELLPSLSEEIPIQSKSKKKK